MTAVARWWAAALALAFGWIQLRPVFDADTFWQLTLGRAVLASHARTFAEPVALAGFRQTAVAPEWLWDISAYAIHRIGGYRWLSFAQALAAVLIVGLLCALTWSFQRRRSFAVWALVALLAAGVTMSRVVLRPQLSYLVLMPLFLWAAKRYWDKPSPIWAVALVAIELGWVQLHGSFVVGPVIFAVFAVAHGPGLVAARRTHLVTALALLLCTITGAYGLHVLGYLHAHADGDAVRHIADMRAPTWESLSPLASYNAAFWALAVLAAIGLTVEDERRLRAGLALIGLAFFVTAVRFIDIAAMAMIPLAVAGAERVLVSQSRRAATMVTGVAVLFVLAFGYQAHHWWGPSGHAGLGVARLPVGAAAFIRTLEPGQRVLSTYEADGALGFFLYGHSRTFVDGRTPLHFDDTDYAVARDIWAREAALTSGLERYAITVAVAPRGSALCAQLAKRWKPVMTEPGFSTFVRSDDPTPALTQLGACGPSIAAACSDETRAELHRVAAISPSPLYAILESDWLVRCRNAVDEAASILPSPTVAWEHAAALTRARARITLARGQLAETFAALKPLMESGDQESIDIACPKTLTAVPNAEARQVLTRAVAQLDDDTPPRTRTLLAALCMLDGDAECVRFQATRAAAQGHPGAEPALRWLLTTPAYQRDAEAWLERLRATPAAQPKQ